MNRREFLQGTAGLVIACGAGFGVSGVKKLLAPTPEMAKGPMLAEDLSLLPTLEGAEVYAKGQLAFKVNTTGATLLRLANGHNSIDSIIEKSGCKTEAVSAVKFFVTLGEAGYLQNRFEVNQVEARL